LIAGDLFCEPGDVALGLDEVGHANDGGGHIDGRPSPACERNAGLEEV
jgi:hypothetical protein